MLPSAALIESVEALTEKIHECDRKLEQIARDRYRKPNF